MITYFLLWIFLAVAVGVYASNKGLSFGSAFVVSCIFSPLVALIVVALSKPKMEVIEQRSILSGEHKQCPFCAELIKPQARVCRYCRRDIPQAQCTTSLPASSQEEYPSQFMDLIRWFAVTVFAFLVFVMIMGLYMMHDAMVKASAAGQFSQGNAQQPP